MTKVYAGIAVPEDAAPPKTVCVSVTQAAQDQTSRVAFIERERQTYLFVGCCHKAR